MDKHNISTYLQLSNYYRKEQKKIWRNITAFKKQFIGQIKILICHYKLMTLSSGGESAKM